MERNGDACRTPLTPRAGVRVPGEGERLAQSDDQPRHITGDDLEDTSFLAKPASGRGDDELTAHGPRVIQVRCGVVLSSRALAQDRLIER
jgi:hypothetical protein